MVINRENKGKNVNNKKIDKNLRKRVKFLKSLEISWNWLLLLRELKDLLIP